MIDMQKAEQEKIENCVPDQSKYAKLLKIYEEERQKTLKMKEARKRDTEYVKYIRQLRDTENLDDKYINGYHENQRGKSGQRDYEDIMRPEKRSYEDVLLQKERDAVTIRHKYDNYDVSSQLKPSQAYPQKASTSRCTVPNFITPADAVICQKERDAVTNRQEYDDYDISSQSIPIQAYRQKTSTSPTFITPTPRQRI